MITGEIYQPDPENVPYWWEYRIEKGDEVWDSYIETYIGLPSQRLTHDVALQAMENELLACESDPTFEGFFKG